ncbi:MAG: citrate/2-methylcitrate synthase [Candidatus Diapherotrites archaeon]
MNQKTSDENTNPMKHTLFDESTQSIIYNLNANAVQRMLDFDYAVKRKSPSIACIVNPTGAGMHKVFFGSKEILIPIYKSFEEAAKKHPKTSIVINFASMRSAYASSKEALELDNITTVAIIAEGIPENRTRELIALAKEKGKWIIGPATVGGVSAGAFRIGNSGGTIENMINSKLHRKGNIGLAAKSGGMSNEMYNMISLNSNGVYEGVAIGGDKFPGNTLCEHLIRMNKNPEIKLLVCLGEIGGMDEYEIVNALEKKQITKPLVMWVTGTCAKAFSSGVQFGHAGAASGTQKESADEKNTALKKAGAVVPNSFDDLGEKIKKEFEKLKEKKIIKEINEVSPNILPKDFTAEFKKGTIRKPTSFICSISDDRGDEVTYNGIPLSKFFEEKQGLGEVISNLWFKTSLPSYGCRFIEMVLITVADHGPCVSGAHNAIVASRAGKDLMSSLASGLLTIGPRFGGAIDGAAYYFSDAMDKGLTPDQFVKEMKSKNINIPGIGHRIKSVQNPDKRVELLKDYAKKNFPKTELLDYSLEVEKITTSKRNNLILNVDGCIGILFADLLRNEFPKEKANEMISLGALNGLFVLGRSIGMIGHIIDQKRLSQGLYRHPWEDVLFEE